MNKKLLAKSNKLLLLAQESDNTLTKKTIIDELSRNKALKTEYQINGAIQYLTDHNVKIIDNTANLPKRAAKRKNNTKVKVNDKDKSKSKSKSKVESSSNTITKDSESKNIINKNIQKLIMLGKENNNEVEDTVIIDMFKGNIDELDTNQMSYILDKLKENDISVVLLNDKIDANSYISNDSEINIKHDDYISEDILHDYMNDIKNYATPLLTPDEERELSVKAKNGDKEAINHMVTSNVKLVISIAKHFNNCGLDMCDLIQEGNIGLLTAIKKFNPDLGFRFSTYATHWIRQAIMRGISNHAKTIRMPIHAIEQARQNKKAFALLYNMYNRQPTCEEVANYVNENKLFASNSIKQVTPESVRLYAQFYNPSSCISLSTPVGEDEHGVESCIGDFIEDTKSNTEEQFMNAELASSIEDVLNTVLSEKEANILRMRFGINCDHSMTLEEIAKLPEYNVTRERIRQIEYKAIRKIRRSRKARLKLIDFANLSRIPNYNNY